MRMLLILGEDALRNACSDYYDARGCEVDSAENPVEAAPLLRFRQYDLLIADLPSQQPARDEVLGLLASARRKATRCVLLTTDNTDAALATEDDWTFVLTKPQPLDAILSFARTHESTRASF
jgi:DNA-binding NtrC family response regulator